MAPEFQLVAANVALDFVNTLDFRYVPSRRVELLPTFDSFVAFASQAGIITSKAAAELSRKTDNRRRRIALGQILEVREALYFLFLSAARRRSPVRNHLRIFNRLYSEIRRADDLVWRRREFSRAFSKMTDTPCGPLCPIMDAAISLLTSSDRRHIGECSDKSCRWLFLDHSKNHSRRWCSMEICGNRAKTNRFQAKLHRKGAT